MSGTDLFLLTFFDEEGPLCMVGRCEHIPLEKCPVAMLTIDGREFHLSVTNYSEELVTIGDGAPEMARVMRVEPVRQFRAEFCVTARRLWQRRPDLAHLSAAQA